MGRSARRRDEQNGDANLARDGNLCLALGAGRRTRASRWCDGARRWNPAVGTEIAPAEPSPTATATETATEPATETPTEQATEPAIVEPTESATAEPSETATASTTPEEEESDGGSFSVASVSSNGPVVSPSITVSNGQTFTFAFTLSSDTDEEVITITLATAQEFTLQSPVPAVTSSTPDKCIFSDYTISVANGGTCTYTWTFTVPADMTSGFHDIEYSTRIDRETTGSAGGGAVQMTVVAPPTILDPVVSPGTPSPLVQIGTIIPANDAGSRYTPHG